MFSYSTGYYVSPPDDQYLKFKNRCSLLRNDEIFYLQAAIQRTMDAACMEYGLAKKITAWAHANREPNKQEN